MTRPVVGLDLSLTSTGIAVHGAGIPDWAGTIKSKGAKTDTWEMRRKRLDGIVSRVIPPIPQGALVAMEAPSYGSTTGSAHDRSGLWWMVFDVLTVQGYAVIPVAPTVRAKYATGKGNAGKDAVLAAAVRRYPGIEIDDNNVADAVVLMAIGCRLLGEPIDDPMPATHLAALDKLPALELKETA